MYCYDEVINRLIVIHNCNDSHNSNDSNDSNNKFGPFGFIKCDSSDLVFHHQFYHNSHTYICHIGTFPTSLSEKEKSKLSHEYSYRVSLLWKGKQCTYTWYQGGSSIEELVPKLNDLITLIKKNQVYI